MKTAMVKELFQYYLDNQNELVEKFDKKYLVISNDHTVNAFDSEDEGYYFALEKYGLGNFLLQLCTRGEEAYTQHFYSPIAIF